MKNITKPMLLVLTIMASFSINAKSYNWVNISQQQYVDNLVSCETQLQEYKWSKNLWPKANKKTKPAFSEVLDRDKTYEKVIANLKMQSVLANYFKTTITNKMLQHDLDRMVVNTKDAKGLEQMFALFDNDAATIAQCISRPYLVRQKIESNYKYNSGIHALVKAQAQSELQAYLDKNKKGELKAIVSTVVYKIKQQHERILNQNLSEALIIELESKEFVKKSQELTNKNLQEKSHSFIFTEILQKSKGSVKVKILSWAKQSINLWLQDQPSEIYVYESNKTQAPFKLSKIIGSNNNLVQMKAGVIGDTWEPTSIGANVPSSRREHTAIWTGTEMIIWGGIGGSNTGGRYDPATDIWMPTSIFSPNGRRLHTAIWTGAEMIVWGGQDNFGYSNSGARYDPGTDSWTSTSGGANVPSPRQYHTAIWSGTEMIIWGGQEGIATYTNTGARYDPSTDRWLPTRSVSSAFLPARWQHTAIWTGTEMIVWGGFRIGGPLNSGARYNPDFDGWSSTSIGANVPSGRYYHTAIWSGTEMIVWGGNDGISNTKYNTGGRYDPNTNNWASTVSTIGSNVPIARFLHTAIWSGTEMIVWGGDDNTGGRYDPNTDSWVSTSIGANVPIGWSGHTAIWSENEMIVWGGNTSTGGIYHPYNTYTISGNLTGLNGNQVILQNNTGDNLTLTANGSFNFVDTLVEGSNYDVTVITDPLSPAQTCLVTNSTGINITADVTDVAVNCVNDFFNVGVTVSGLAVGNSVFFENNTQNLMRVSDNDVLTNFTTPVGNGLDYLITIDTQPSDPTQACSITPGEETGTVNGADVNVAVTCVPSQYNISVTVTGLDANNSIELTTNSQSLLFNSNTTLNFTNPIDNGISYAILLTAQPINPIQTCTITGGNSGNDDGSGTLTGSDAVISVDCNIPLVTVANTYTAFEDITLIANDADGSVTGVNNDGVLVNDSDVDGDTLTIVNTGMFMATGLGGSVTFAADGTFSYAPPADISGQDVLNFDVTDGVNTVGSTLTIDVLPVNDAPTFSILGNVLSAELHPNIVNTTLTIPMFAFDINAGANDESSQLLQFAPIILADSNSVLVANGVSLNNVGELTLDFTGNIGLVIIRLILIDDGSNANGGDGVSSITEFIATYNDMIFMDGFEEPQVNKLFNFLDGIKSKSPLSNYPTNDTSDNSLSYYGHKLKIDGAYMTPQVIKQWVTEVELFEASTPY